MFQFGYNADDVLDKITDPRGAHTNLAYYDHGKDGNSEDRIKSITDRLRAATTFTYGKGTSCCGS